MPTIEEIKIYLGIDGSYLDSLLIDFLEFAKNLIEKVLRQPLSNFEIIPPTIKETAKYIVASYYNERSNANSKEIETNVAIMLSEYRVKEF